MIRLDLIRWSLLTWRGDFGKVARWFSLSCSPSVPRLPSRPGRRCNTGWPELLRRATRRTRLRGAAGPPAVLAGRTAAERSGVHLARLGAQPGRSGPGPARDRQRDRLRGADHAPAWCIRRPPARTLLWLMLTWLGLAIFLIARPSGQRPWSPDLGAAGVVTGLGAIARWRPAGRRPVVRISDGAGIFLACLPRGCCSVWSPVRRSWCCERLSSRRSARGAQLLAVLGAAGGRTGRDRVESARLPGHTTLGQRTGPQHRPGPGRPRLRGVVLDETAGSTRDPADRPTGRTGCWSLRAS